MLVREEGGGGAELVPEGGISYEWAGAGAGGGGGGARRRPPPPPPSLCWIYRAALYMYL